MQTSKSIFIFSACLLLLSIYLFGRVGFDVFTAKTGVPRFDCTSYSPYIVDINDYTSPEQIRQDLQLIKQYSPCIRTYTTKNGLDVVPDIAEELGMTVILGTWIDKVSDEANNQEVDRAIGLANNHTNIRMIVVGNEMPFLNWQKMDKLTYVKYLKYLKSKTDTPLAMTTSAGYIDQYGLYDYLDIVGLHVFPYWDSVFDVEDDKNFIFDEINKVRLFIEQDLRLKKEIQVLEYGQPWMGVARGENAPSLRYQREHAHHVTEQLRQAGIFANYYQVVSEKRINDIDGYLYRLWGLLTKSGKDIVIVQQNLYLKIIGLICLALFLTIYGLRKLKLNILQTCHLLYLTSIYIIFGAIIYTIKSIFGNDYFLLQVGYYLPLVLLVLVYVKSVFEFWEVKAPLSVVPGPAEQNGKVAILIPSKGEDLLTLKKTLQSCIKQTHQDLELMLIDNGTQTEEYAKNIKALCTSFNEPRLKYVYFENKLKNKSSVLNQGLKQISADATHILFVDADYILESDAISRGLSHFTNETVRVVQYPQTYEKTDSFIGQSARIEQEYVAHLSQPFRNRTNTVILNGTLCFFRREVFDKYMWDEGTVCEDAMLGAEIQLNHEKILYIDEVIGKGLAPRNMSELIVQRFRWSAGAAQVMIRLIFSKEIYRNPAVVLQYLWGWLPWLVLIPICVSIPVHILFLYNIDTYHALFNIFIPIQPLIALCLLSMLIFSMLIIRIYLNIKPGDFLRSILLQLALVNTIVIGMLVGFFRKNISFAGTRGLVRHRAHIWVVPTALSFVLLWLLVVVYQKNHYINNLYSELNMLVPILIALIPQLAQIAVFAIDKSQK